MHLRHWITVFILLKVKQSQTERLSLMIIRASNPAIEVSVLKETKHLPHVEAPEAFLEQVKIFF